jgi:hypothetical protein
MPDGFLLCFIIIAGRVLSLTQDIAISSEKEQYVVYFSEYFPISAYAEIFHFPPDFISKRSCF